MLEKMRRVVCIWKYTLFLSIRRGFFIIKIRNEVIHMTDIILLSGSPSISSRTDLALQSIGRSLKANGFDIKHISIQDIPAEVLIEARYDHPQIKELTTL